MNGFKKFDTTFKFVQGYKTAVLEHYSVILINALKTIQLQLWFPRFLVSLAPLYSR